jgi:CIC family chloride channel protein
MYAIHYHGGRMRPRVAGLKALASALSIGSGASVGREGPIVQIGAVLGAAIGFLARAPAHQRVVLVAGAAAAGIAATFNAPLGGLAFAIELLLISVSARNVALVASASAAATCCAGLLGGFDALFAHLPLPAAEAGGLHQLLLWAPFGVLAGLAATALERGIAGVEDVSSAWIPNDYLRHGLAMLIVGLMLYAFVERTGQYYVAGIGYPVIEAILAGVLADPAFLFLLFAAKLVATTLALGTGASGGVFAPGLFLGAALGAGYGSAMDWLWPALGIDPVVGAMAGMAAVVGATSAAVVTAVVMVLELTQGYAAVLPSLLSVSLAYIVRRRLARESIYTLNLARRGRRVPTGLEASLSGMLDASRVMSADFEVIDHAELADWQRVRRMGRGARYSLVAVDGEVVGMARPAPPHREADEHTADAIAGDCVLVAPDTGWATLMRSLQHRDDRIILVGDSRRPQDLVGIITEREIARAARDKADLMD